MAQIKGVINQAHRNNELEQIKQMYNSSTGNDANEDSILETNKKMEQLNGGESELNNEEEDQMGNEIPKSFEQILNLWKSMLEDECLDDNLEGDEDELVVNNTSLEIFISIKKHPQRDLQAKWKLADLFAGELGPPYYINNL